MFEVGSKVWYWSDSLQKSVKMVVEEVYPDGRVQLSGKRGQKLDPTKCHIRKVDDQSAIGDQGEAAPAGDAGNGIDLTRSPEGNKSEGRQKDEVIPVEEDPPDDGDGSKSMATSVPTPASALGDGEGQVALTPIAMATSGSAVSNAVGLTHDEPGVGQTGNEGGKLPL